MSAVLPCRCFLERELWPICILVSAEAWRTEGKSMGLFEIHNDSRGTAEGPMLDGYSTSRGPCRPREKRGKYRVIEA